MAPRLKFCQQLTNVLEDKLNKNKSRIIGGVQESFYPVQRLHMHRPKTGNDI